MATLTLQPPALFDFSKPGDLPKWIKQFKQYHVHSKKYINTCSYVFCCITVRVLHIVKHEKNSLIAYSAIFLNAYHF